MLRERDLVWQWKRRADRGDSRKKTCNLRLESGSQDRELEKVGSHLFSPHGQPALAHAGRRMQFRLIHAMARQDGRLACRVVELYCVQRQRVLKRWAGVTGDSKTAISRSVCRATRIGLISAG